MDDKTIDIKIRYNEECKEIVLDKIQTFLNELHRDYLIHGYSFSTMEPRKDPHEAYMIGGVEMSELEKAMKIVIDAIRNDEGYRIGWKANIAMAFVDNFRWSTDGLQPSDYPSVHEIANKSADYFLDLLTKEVKDE